MMNEGVRPEQPMEPGAEGAREQSTASSDTDSHDPRGTQTHMTI